MESLRNVAHSISAEIYNGISGNSGSLCNCSAIGTYILFIYSATCITMCVVIRIFNVPGKHLNILQRNWKIGKFAGLAYKFNLIHSLKSALGFRK